MTVITRTPIVAARCPVSECREPPLRLFAMLALNPADRVQTAKRRAVVPVECNVTDVMRPPRWIGNNHSVASYKTSDVTVEICAVLCREDAVVAVAVRVMSERLATLRRCLFSAWSGNERVQEEFVK